MCLVKTPKIKDTGATDPNKPLPVLRNPILDGIDPSIQSLRIGRSSLRIDRVFPGDAPPPPMGGGTPAPSNTPPPSTGTPYIGGGGSGGPGRSGGGSRLLKPY